MSDTSTFTPYSTISPFFGDNTVEWVPVEHAERLAAYLTYEQMYWNMKEAFRFSMRGTNDQPVYIPCPRTVVDETSHYLLKGLSISDAAGDESTLAEELKKFLKREQFYSRFHTAKHAGVFRGDYVLHLTADAEKAEGRRLSINSIDPGSYFPIYDPDDLDHLLGVDIVERYEYEGKNRVKQLRYIKDSDLVDARILRQERILEIDEWWDGKAAKVVQVILKEEALEPGITSIPVYAFRNITNDGDPFGSSELRGFETVLGGINNTVSDEDLALALDGLGVWATDAPSPIDPTTKKQRPWEVFPGAVAQLPMGHQFKRVEGIRSVAPMLEHLAMLQDSLYEGASTFRGGKIDVQVAESGIALAIRFMPTLGKIEQRDEFAKAELEHLFYDWQIWHDAYEPTSVGDPESNEIEITLGDKLPTNRVEIFNELNQLYDRKIITAEYYRQQVEKRLDYKFPKSMGKDVLKEQEEIAKARMVLNPAAEEQNSTLPQTNQSNNKSRPNESAGTEAKSQNQ